jgi:phosphoesterase RecJ-like protein
LGRALTKLESNFRTSHLYTTLTQDELNTFGYVKGDTEGIVNYGLSIKGIVLQPFLSKCKDEKIIKISLSFTRILMSINL